MNSFIRVENINSKKVSYIDNTLIPTNVIVELIWEGYSYEDISNLFFDLTYESACLACAFHVKYGDPIWSKRWGWWMDLCENTDFFDLPPSVNNILKTVNLQFYEFIYKCKKFISEFSELPDNILYKTKYIYNTNVLFWYLFIKNALKMSFINEAI